VNQHHTWVGEYLEETPLLLQTPLSLAASRGSDSVVKLLLAQDNIGVNRKDSYGNTPLLSAVSRGRESVVRLLLARNDVDVNSKNERGDTPLFLAVNGGHESVVRLLHARVRYTQYRDLLALARQAAQRAVLRARASESDSRLGDKESRHEA
jgi:ankyrin repeat protein